MKAKHSLVSYLNNREIGNSLWSKKQGIWQHDPASVVAEEKATSPTKNVACELSGHSRSTFLITFSPNGQFIGSTHGDHTVRVTDVTSGKCLHILKGHPRTPWSIAFHPISNNLLASGCLAGHVRIWDLHGGGSEVWKTPKNTVVTSLTFHPAGQVLLIATSNNILFWDWSQPQPFAECATRSVYEKVRWVQFDSQGHFLYTGIANTTSVQGEETEENSTPENDQSVRRGDANQLRDRYQMIVEQITSMQRDGVLSGTVSDWHVMSRRQSDSQTEQQDDAPATSGRPSTSEDVEADAGSEFLPQSPESSQSLEDATNYASLVTLATTAAMLNRLGMSAASPSMSRQEASASQRVADSVTSSVMSPVTVSCPPVARTSNLDPRSWLSRRTPITRSEETVQSDSAERNRAAGPVGAQCTTVPSAPLQGNATPVSSSDASADAPQTDFPQCTVLSRPTIGRSTNDETSESARTRRVNRLLLPPVLGNCAPSTTVESHFSPVHMSSSSDHVTDGAAAASVSDSSSSEPSHRCTVLGESRRSATVSSAHAVSLGSNPRGGSISMEQTALDSSGESDSTSRMLRVVVPTPHTNASAGTVDDGRNSSNVTTQSRSERALTWQRRREDSGEDMDQDRASREWPGLLHTIDVPATGRQADTGESTGGSWTAHRRWSGALQQRVWTMRRELARRRQERRETQRRWHVSPRHHLHPHYSVSILDGSNRSSNGLQAAINRAIAGAFTARGEASVASNIDNLTHRIQRWDISSRFKMPDIDDRDISMVVSHCKIHNDTSCDISKDGTLLTTFVPSHQGFPDDTILGVFSLCPESLGQCMFTKSFGPNAISVSLSPLNNYVLVGLAARRLAWVFAQQMVGQVYRLKTAVAGEDSMQTSCDFQHVCDLMHPCDTDMQSHVSVNTACWLPDVGQGIAYATNKGDLHICTPGCDKAAEKPSSVGSSLSVRQNLMQMLGLTVPRHIHHSSVGRPRQNTGSQTDSSFDHSD